MKTNEERVKIYEKFYKKAFKAYQETNPLYTKQKGPWDTEPNSVIFIDEDTQLECLILRSPYYGSLFGYVILPEGHSFDEEKLEKLKVHGSVSFTGFHQFANNKYCVGFDCSHAWDWVPYHERRSYDARLSPVYIEELKDVEYRDIEYVKKECTKLAKQIYNLKQKEQKNDNRI